MKMLYSLRYHYFFFPEWYKESGYYNPSITLKVILRSNEPQYIL